MSKARLRQVNPIFGEVYATKRQGSDVGDLQPSPDHHSDQGQVAELHPPLYSLLFFSQLV